MDSLSINGLGSMRTAQLNNLKSNSASIKKCDCENNSCPPSFKGISLTKNKPSKFATLAIFLIISLLALFGCQKQPRIEYNEYYIDPNDSTYINFMDSVMHVFDSIEWPWSGSGPS